MMINEAGHNGFRQLSQIARRVPPLFRMFAVAAAVFAALTIFDSGAAYAQDCIGCSSGPVYPNHPDTTGMYFGHWCHEEGYDIVQADQCEHSSPEPGTCTWHESCEPIIEGQLENVEELTEWIALIEVAVSQGAWQEAKDIATGLDGRLTYDPTTSTVSYNTCANLKETGVAVERATGDMLLRHGVVFETLSHESRLGLVLALHKDAGEAILSPTKARQQIHKEKKP